MAISKLELEKAIEKGESVWGCLSGCLLEICNDNTVKIDENIIGSTEINEYGFDFIDLKNNLFYLSFKDVYRTKAEAEHYLHHANITRTETVPFLTWEEFKEGVELSTTAKNGEKLKLYIGLIPDDSIYYMYMKLGNKQQNVGEATEANFYKAYDECVRLFTGE